MPETPPATDVTRHELRVAARPETVFGYFTDPSRMVQWMGAEATLDPRPGGVCRLVFHPADAIDLIDATFGNAHHEAVARLGPRGARVMAGEFVAVEPYRRVAFTWGWEQALYEMPPQATAVDVTFEPDGDGTVVRLVHTRLPAGAAARFHGVGWDHYLARLAVAAAGDDPGRDPWEGTGG